MYYEPNSDVIAERSGERAVLLAADGTSIITLNPVGALVWEELPATLDAVVTNLSAEFPDVDEQLLRDDATAFLAELESHGLVVELDAAG